MPLPNRLTLKAILALVILWETFAFGMRNPRVAPHIPELITVSFPSFSLFSGVREPDGLAAAILLIRASFATLCRVFLGFAFGTLLGLALGAVPFLLPGQRRSSKWLLAALRSIPLFALLPLWVYWFSGSEFGIISYITFAVAVFIGTGVYEGMAQTPRHWLNHATVLKASSLFAFKHIILPGALPAILHQVYWVSGLLPAFCLGAEYTGSALSGLGGITYQSYLYANVGQLLILALIYLFLGLTIRRLVYTFTIAPQKLLYL